MDIIVTKVLVTKWIENSILNFVMDLGIKFVTISKEHDSQ